MRTLDVPSVENPEKSQDVKEQEVTVACEEAAGCLNTSNKSSTSKIVKDQPPSTVTGSDDLKSEAELPPSSVKESDTNSGEPPEPTKTSKDVEMSEPSPSEKNELQQTVLSNVVKEPSNSVEVKDQVDVVSNSMPPKKNEDQQLVIVNSGEKPPSEAPRDVDMVPESEHLEKNEPPQPAESNATVEKRASTVLSFLFYHNKQYKKY